MKTKLLEDLKQSMKEKDTVRKNTIQLVRTEILQVEKDKKVELNNDDIVVLISRIVSKRESNLKEFLKTDRVNLISDLQREIELLKTYLPEQLSIEDLTEIIDNAIINTGATSMKDMRLIISEIEPVIKGKADMKTVSQIVKERLGASN